MTVAERAQAALDAAFAEQIGQRFAAYNEWVASGGAEMDGAPRVRFERGLRQLQANYADAQAIVARVFGA